MKEVSQVTALVCDRGLFSDIAVRLAQEYKRVLYYVPNKDGFPLPNASYVGHGLEGIEVVDDIYGDHFPYVDLFVFPDIGDGHEQQRLRDAGKCVWGSNMSEALENDRSLCKELFEEEGLPVGPYEVVHGLKELRKYLSVHENVFVKIPKWRGLTETFFAKNLKSVEPKLNRIALKAGPVADIMEIVVEDELPDMEEVGYDGYSVDGLLPLESLVGVEGKDLGFAGRIIEFDKLAEPVRRVTSAMAEMMESYDHRGAFSNEIRMGKRKEPFMIDACMRCPNPPSALYSMMYTNFPEIVWQGANGNIVDPEYKFTHGVQLQGKSKWADGEEWLPVDIKEKHRDNIRLANGAKFGDQYWHVPLRGGLEEVVNIVGWGNSYEAASKMAEEMIEKVSACDLKFDIDVLKGCIKSIEKLKAFGVDLT